MTMTAETPAVSTPDAVTQRYRAALDSFVEKVKQDRMILAVILCGSLSHDRVWEKSDIDLLLIGREEIKTTQDYVLIEDGINIHAVVMSRSKFRERLEKSLQSSFFHSYFSKSTLLYATDDSIKDFYENARHLGERDREIQLLHAGTNVLGTLYKAEKWFHFKKDIEYAFLYLMYLADNLATIEVVMNREVTGREVIHQALKFNPVFFNAIYTDLIHCKKDADAIRNALDLINGYLDEKVYLLFQPILDYLTEAGGVRSTTEINEYFAKRMQAGFVGLACEYLADKGIIEKVPTPVRLSEKSRATVDEAAYYYDGGE